MLFDVVVDRVPGPAEHLHRQLVGLEAPLRRPRFGDRGEDVQKRLRGHRLLRRARLLVVDQSRAEQAQRQRALHVRLLGEQHPPHVRVTGEHHLRRRRIGAGGPALGPVARVVQRLEVAGVADRGGTQAHAEPGLVHHGEHLLEAGVLLAHEVPDRARPPAGGVYALPEGGHGVDRAAEAHLVVEAGDDDVVALTERAVVVDEVLGHDEQADAAGAGGGAGHLGQDEVDDVLGHLVLAAGDPHLLAEQAVGTVGLRLGAGGDVGEVGAGVRLGQAHRPRETALDHRLDVRPDLLVGAVCEQQVGVAGGEQRIGGRGDVGRVEPGHARQVRGVGQLHAADPLVHRRAHEVGLGELRQRLADLGDELDLLAHEAGLGEVGLAEVGREVGLGELGRQVQHGVDRLAGVVGVALAPGQLGHPQPVVQEEVEVGAGQEVGGGHAPQVTRGWRARTSVPSRSSSSRRRRAGAACLGRTSAPRGRGG